ncbi:MAG: MBL fold metallo-hydrolase [Gammaproteobacteria bacterium]|nr:MBL fold metallo-hydrolase [Gammaproteobacteria bacterium]
MAIVPKPLMDYEFAESPAAGDTMRVAHGVYWLRMPLPFALAHINLWLLEDDDAWTIVDSGVATDETKSVWEKTFSERMHGRNPGRVIVTHLHPDHAGCAGWLAGRFDIPLWMSREEYLLCRVLVADTGRMAPEAGDRFYHAAGFPPEALQNYHKIFGYFGRFVSPLPESYKRIRDAEKISVGGSDWEVIVGRGHSPEHACLFNAEQNLLISGDQLLPTISSNVSVYPTEPQADPLGEWLDSLANLRARIPQDVLVLPAHGKPFRGAHERLDALKAEHESCLEQLLEYCREPKRAIDVFPVLFKKAIDRNNLILATGESIAHLNYLLARGFLGIETDRAGVHWYGSN